jgi:hypothetical protein
MSETRIEIKFVPVVLATRRFIHLLANEDDLADLIVRLRARLVGGFASNSACSGSHQAAVAPNNIPK